MRNAGQNAGELYDRLRWAEFIGRPLGSAAFLENVEAMLDRPIAPGARTKAEVGG